MQMYLDTQEEDDAYDKECLATRSYMIDRCSKPVSHFFGSFEYEQVCTQCARTQYIMHDIVHHAWPRYNVSCVKRMTLYIMHGLDTMYRAWRSTSYMAQTQCVMYCRGTACCVSDPKISSVQHCHPRLITEIAC